MASESRVIDHPRHPNSKNLQKQKIVARLKP